MNLFDSGLLIGCIIGIFVTLLFCRYSGQLLMEDAPKSKAVRVLASLLIPVILVLLLMRLGLGIWRY